MNSAPPPSDNDFSDTLALVVPPTVDGGNSSHNTVSFSAAIINTYNTGIEVISDDEEDLPPLLLVDFEGDDSSSIRDDDWKKRYQQAGERREYQRRYFHQISSRAEYSPIMPDFMDGFAGSYSVIPRSGGPGVIGSRATTNLPLADPVNVYAYGHTQDAIDRMFNDLMNIN
jgi:hypothetical protein